MPKSKIRKKDTYTPKAVAVKPKKAASYRSGRWVAPTMVALFLIGLAWIVVFYISGGNIPVMDHFGNVNILIGFAFIGAGFVAATRWK